MPLTKTQAARLAKQIFDKFDKQIEEATTGTVVPTRFIAGLIANEAGKFRDGTINRSAMRFEPGVYRHLIAVRDGKQSKYGNIVRGDIRDASDAAIRALSTSYEATQIMGYHVIHTLRCTLADLRNPDKHFHYTVKMLLVNGFPPGADNERMAEEMRQWNTGSEHGATYHADYVPNAKAVRDAYAELEKTRSHRTVEERIAGVVDELPQIQSESIQIPAADDAAKTETPEPKQQTPTGEQVGDGEAPQILVQPTKLKGWAVAVIGAITTFLGSGATWWAGLPAIVQASIFIGGGLATSTLIGGVIWIKNQREERAAQKELALINAKGNAQA